MSEMKLTIYDEDTKQNFLPWMQEKIEHILTELLRISKHKNKTRKGTDNPIITDDDIINGNLDYAISDTIKIYSACYGISELYSDRDIFKFICNNYIDGLEYVNYYFGISSQKGKIHKLLEDNEELEQIQSLITPDKLNRTLIHTHLAKLHYHNSWTEQISDDIEQVTYGEKSWDWFYNRHKNDVASEHYFDAPFIPDSLKRC